MMKRNLIALTLLFILAMAFLAVPVSAGLTLEPGGGATITTTDGETTYEFKITVNPIAEDGSIIIDAFLLSQFIQSESGFTDDNVMVADSAADATWTRAVDEDYLLTLTSTGGATVVGETVTVTFTGEENRWINNAEGEFTYDPDYPTDWIATRTDLDGGTATFDFKIDTPVAPTFDSAVTNAEGTVITITFDKVITNPGSPDDFKYQIGDGDPQEFSTAALNAEDNTYSIDLKTSGTPIAPDDDDVTVMYTEGTVKATDNSVLETFSVAQNVDNKMPIPVPTVTKIYPTSGPVDGGTEVKVTGTGFTGATDVKFGEKSVEESEFSVDSDTQITVTSPDGAAGPPVHVIVTTKVGGPSDESAVDADHFTYIPPPIVGSIDPDTGINTGLVSFIIEGADFVDGATVILTKDGQTIDPDKVVYDSPTKITCDFTMTGETTGTWNIIVTNPDGQNSASSGNNLFQMIGLAVANAVSNPSSYQSSSDTDSSTGNAPGAGTGQSSAPASVVEPGVQEAPASPAATEAVTAELSVTDQGVVTEATEMQSPDGRATVSIDQGVVALDQAGAPVSSVSIDTLGPSDMPDVPQGGAVSFAGIAYELGPNGAQFSPAISITFAAPPGQVGQDFTVRTYDHVSDTWQDLPTSYDPQTGTVTAEVSHFCCFALFAKTVTTAPAIAATIAATPVLTPLIPTTIAPPSPTIATTFLGIVLWVVNLMIANPMLLAGIAILAVGIVLMIWKQRRDRLNFRP